MDPEPSPGARSPRPFQVHVIELAGLRLALRGRDLDDALAEAARAEERGDPGATVPYWAELWPSARALAAWVVGDGAPLVAGRVVLELGAGLGLGALAAALAGAEAAIATDLVEEALGFALANAAAAGVGARVTAARLDWRDPARWRAAERSAPPPWPTSGRFEVAIGADLLYDAANLPLLLGCLERVLAPGGSLFLADPRRQAGQRLRWAAAERGFDVAPVGFARVDGRGEVRWGTPDEPAAHALGGPVDILRLRAPA